MELVQAYDCGVAVFVTAARLRPYLVTHTEEVGLRSTRPPRGDRRDGIATFERTEEEAHAEAQRMAKWLRKFKRFPKTREAFYPWSEYAI